MYLSLDLERHCRKQSITIPQTTSQVSIRDRVALLPCLLIIFIEIVYR